MLALVTVSDFSYRCRRPCDATAEVELRDIFSVYTSLRPQCHFVGLLVLLCPLVHSCQGTHAPEDMVETRHERVSRSRSASCAPSSPIEDICLPDVQNIYWGEMHPLSFCPFLRTSIGLSEVLVSLISEDFLVQSVRSVHLHLFHTLYRFCCAFINPHRILKRLQTITIHLTPGVPKLCCTHTIFTSNSIFKSN